MGSFLRRFSVALALSTIILSGSALAQSPNTPWNKALFGDKEAYKEAYKHYQKGESLYKQGVYSKALTHYLPANDFNSNNADLNLKIY